MGLSVSPIHNSNISFLQKNSVKNTKGNSQDKNPVSKNGERMKLLSATFAAGLGIGARLLWEIWDGDFLFETAGDLGERLIDKNKKGVRGNKRLMLWLGATAGVLAAGVSAFAIIYTLFKTPKIEYDAKLNAFQKGKDMDVYIKGNQAEKELYTQLGEKAKTASDEEKKELAKQYLQLKAGKNKLPDFIKI